MEYLSILLIPLLCSFFLGIFGRVLGRKGSFKLTIISFFFLYFYIFNIFFDMVQGKSFEVLYIVWFNLIHSFNFGFIFDSLSVYMCLIIIIISSCVIIYSYEYMEYDLHLIRFLSYMFLFIFFMLFLVVSNNLLQSFLGWEGVGLVSYLLVNFWFTRLEANKSAIKAILFNRIGDIAFIFGIILMLEHFKICDFNFCMSLNLYDQINLLNEMDVEAIELISLCIFIAAMAKSAQIGLHAWLPDAMEGPTPVSSLLHSATMVTAGIYVILRLSVLFQFCPRLNLVIAIIGGLTCLLGASVALFQEDIKKIIAYSTCSQLGVLMVALGIGNYVGCFFHLITHAFFKALLFLTAGCIIHALLDEQDIRKMGGLLRYMPYTSFCMLIGILGLVGFPYISGFYSKEFILLFTLANRSIIYNYIFQYIFIGGIFTICYSLKLFFFLFLSSYRGSRTILQFTSDTGILTCFALFILVILTMFSGFILHSFFLNFNDFLWYGVFTNPENAEDLFIKAEKMHEFNKNGLTYFFFFLLRTFFKKSKSLITYRLVLYQKDSIYNAFYNFFIIFFYFSWNFHFFFVRLNRFFISISNNLIIDIMSLFEYIFFIYFNHLLKNLSGFLSEHFNILNFYKYYVYIFFILLLVIVLNFVLFHDFVFLLIIFLIFAEHLNRKVIYC